METKTTTERKELVESIFILANACRDATNDSAYAAILDALESEYIRPLISKSSSERKLSLLSRTFSGYIEQAIQPEMKKVRGEEARSLLTTLISALQYGFDLQAELSFEELVLAVLCHKRIRTAHNQQASKRDKETVKESIGQVDLETKSEKVREGNINSDSFLEMLLNTALPSAERRALVKEITSASNLSVSDDLEARTAKVIEQRGILDRLQKAWIERVGIPALEEIESRLKEGRIDEREVEVVEQMKNDLRKVVFGYQNLVGSEEAREAIGVKVNQMSRYVMRNQVGYQISRFAVFSLDEVAYFASKPRQAGRPKNS